MKRKASVVIVERLPLLRDALARLLEQLGAQVVGRTATLATGLHYVKSLVPELLVLDRTAAPQDVGIRSVVGAVRSWSPSTRIVLLFCEFDGLEVRQARRAGVSGCLLKRCKTATLRRALERGLAGPVTDSRTTPQRTAALHRLGGVKADGETTLARLTERELEVLPYVARGFSAAHTAQILGIRPKTVDAHKVHIMAKLGIHDRVTLTRLAIRENLIPLWED